MLFQAPHDLFPEHLEQEYDHRREQYHHDGAGIGAGQGHVDALGLKIEANDRVGNDQCNERAKERVSEIVSSHQIFSTSGLPSRPVGLNSRIRISRLNEITSLYSPLR